MSEGLTLPRGWIRATIGDLVSEAGVFCDGDWVESEDQDPQGDVRLIQLADVGDGEYRDRSSRFLTSAKARALNCTFLEPGDVLIARMPDPLGRACIFPGDAKRAVTVVDVCIVRTANVGVDHRWLQWFINAPRFRVQVAGLQSGSTRKRISRGNLSTLTLPVPPSGEQCRIVAKIEELFSDLDAGVAALERVRANLKRYRAAVLKAAVEGRPATEPAAKLLERILAERRAKWEQDQLRKFKEAGKTPPKGWKENFEDSSAALTDGLGSLPHGWSWSNIDRIADVQGGIQKQPKRAPADNAYPYLRVANVRRDQLLLDDMERFELFPGELERLRLEPNDLLIVEGNGSLTEIGRSAIWRGEIPNCVHQNHIIRVRPLGGVVTGFVNMYWNSPNGAKRVMAEAASTSGLYTLSVTKVCRLPVPIPPLAEQAEIVAEVDRRLSVADAAETQVEHALQRAARLRQAILKRAFEGKLVPQKPTDEPAAAMLEHPMASGNGHHAVAETATHPAQGPRSAGAAPVLDHCSRMVR
jgi:type I restriction enzyme, S subunit